MRIYVAGPFFNEQERSSILHMISLIKYVFKDAELFIPMEHEIPGGEDLPNDFWAKCVFDMDVNAINSCNLVVSMYTGHYSDTGTVWEIGYAYANKIPIIGYIPEWAKSEDMSLMVLNSWNGILSEEGKLLTIKDLIKYNQK